MRTPVAERSPPGLVALLLPEGPETNFETSFPRDPLPSSHTLPVVGDTSVTNPEVQLRPMSERADVQTWGYRVDGKPSGSSSPLRSARSASTGATRHRAPDRWWSSES